MFFKLTIRPAAPPPPPPERATDDCSEISAFSAGWGMVNSLDMIILYYADRGTVQGSAGQCRAVGWLKWAGVASKNCKVKLIIVFLIVVRVINKH